MNISDRVNQGPQLIHTDTVPGGPERYRWDTTDRRAAGGQHKVVGLHSNATWLHWLPAWHVCSANTKTTQITDWAIKRNALLPQLLPQPKNRLKNIKKGGEKTENYKIL